MYLFSESNRQTSTLLIQAFEQTAAQYPLNTAIHSENKVINYYNLNAQANQWARYLKQLKLTPNMSQAHCNVNDTIRVGIYLPQSIEITLSLLAVMKAGYAFITLSTDSEMPVQRLETIIHSARPQVIITSRTLEHKAILQAIREQNFHIIYAEDLSELCRQYSDNNLVENLEAHQLAYIYYTSGSTGTPKGVMVSHRNLLNCMMSVIKTLQMNEQSRVAQFAPIGFDASLMEIFIALLCGGQLFLVPYDENGHLNISTLSNFYTQHCIDIGILVPSVLNILEPQAFPYLKKIIYTGEKTPEETRLRWSCQAEKELYDGYGPTECTIGATLNGLPMQGVKVLLLENNPSAHFETVATGIQSEIYLSGDCVGLGYWGEKELTQKRFLRITNPDNPDQQINIYKTGDLGILQADGTLKIMGRIDRQIKLHGKLICSEEIEEALESYSTNDGERVFCRTYVEAIADAQERTPVFIAFAFTKHADFIPSIEEIQNFLKTNTKLTQSMIPSRWIFLNKSDEEKVLNNNRKIDRKNLWYFVAQSNSTYSPRMREAYRELTLFENEKELIRLWHKSLNLVPCLKSTTNPPTVDDHIYIILQESVSQYVPKQDDHFFHLGGTSIQCALLLSYIEKHFELRVSLSEFMINPTLGFLLRQLRWAKRKPLPLSLVSLNQQYNTHEKLPPEKVPVFFIHSLLGNTSLDYPELEALCPKEMPIFGLNAAALTHPEMMGDCFEEIAERYLQAMAQVYEGDFYILAGWSGGGLAAITMQEILKKRQKKAVVIMFDTQSSSSFQLMSTASLKRFLSSLIRGKVGSKDSNDDSVRNRIPLNDDVLNQLFDNLPLSWPKQKVIIYLLEKLKAEVSALEHISLEEKLSTIGLLTTIENVLISALRQRLPEMVEDVILIPAKKTQEICGERLLWPEQWPIDIKPAVEGDHFFMKNQALVRGIGFYELIDQLYQQHWPSFGAKKRAETLRNKPESFYQQIPWGAAPKSNPEFTGREKEILAMQEAFQDKTTKIFAQGIVGLGGSGKTELTAQYLHLLKEDEKRNSSLAPHEHPYALKIWLTGEKSQLGSDLKELAHWLGISPAPTDSVEVIAANVYEFLARLSKKFSRPRVLLIVDDAEEFKGLSKLIPLSNEHYINCFHWLITSREQAIWEKPDLKDIFKLHLLDVFTPDESMEYLQRRLPLQEPNNIAMYHSLSAKLEYLPLALTIASAYLNQEGTQAGIIEEFSANYDHFHKNILLKYKHSFQYIQNTSIITIATLWQITLEKLRKNKQDKAIVALLYLAYLKGDFIENYLIVKFLKVEIGNKDNLSLLCQNALENYLTPLKNYSLISESTLFKESMRKNTGGVRIHSLLQEAIRLWQQNKQNRKFLTKNQIPKTILAQWKNIVRRIKELMEIPPDDYSQNWEELGELTLYYLLLPHVHHLLSNTFEKETASAKKLKRLITETIEHAVSSKAPQIVAKERHEIAQSFWESSLIENDSYNIIINENNIITDVQPEENRLLVLNQLRANASALGIKKTINNSRYFQLPAKMDGFVGRREELTILEANLLKHQVGFQVIYGLGGMGKTSLALHYAYSNIQEYDFILCLHAEAGLLEQLQALAEGLGIGAPDDKKMLMRIICANLCEKRVLWILDNADLPEKIKDYLPLVEKGSMSCHTIITSRQAIFEFSALNLIKFNEKDGYLYVENHLGEQKAHCMRALLEAVDYLPLALTHAVAYIKQGNASIEDYPKHFKEHQFKNNLKSTDTVLDTVRTSLTLSLMAAKIKIPLTLKLLFACVDFPPENIPILLLTLFIEEDVAIIENSINLLLDYSIITKDSDTISLHRLVLGVLQEENSFVLVRKSQLVRWGNLFINLLEDPYREIAELHFYNQIIKYSGIIILSQFNKGKSLQKALLQYCVGIHEKFQVDRFRGDGEDHFLRKALPVLIHHLGFSDTKVALTRIALAGGDLRHDLILARKRLEESLPIIKYSYDENHPYIATIYTILGIVYASFDLLDKARTLLEHALLIGRRYKFPNYRLEPIVYNLWYVYFHMEDIETRKSFYENEKNTFKLLLRKHVIDSPTIGISYFHENECKNIVTPLVSLENDIFLADIQRIIKHFELDGDSSFIEKYTSLSRKIAYHHVILHEESPRPFLMQESVYQQSKDYQNMGDLLFSYSRVSAAVDYYCHSIKLVPDIAYSYRNLGFCYYWMAMHFKSIGSVNESHDYLIKAKNTFETGLTIPPSSAVLVEYASFLWQEEGPETALEMIEKSLDFSEETVIAYPSIHCKNCIIFFLRHLFNKHLALSFSARGLALFLKFSYYYNYRQDLEISFLLLYELKKHVNVQIINLDYELVNSCNHLIKSREQGDSYWKKDSPIDMDRNNPIIDTINLRNAKTNHKLRKYQEAIEQYKITLKHYGKPTSEDQQKFIAIICFLLGDAYENNDDFAEALSVYKTSLEIYSSLPRTGKEYVIDFATLSEAIRRTEKICDDPFHDFNTYERALLQAQQKRLENYYLTNLLEQNISTNDFDITAESIGDALTSALENVLHQEKNIIEVVRTPVNEFVLYEADKKNDNIIIIPPSQSIDAPSYANLMAKVSDSPLNEGIRNQRREDSKTSEGRWYEISSDDDEFILTVVTRFLTKTQVNFLQPIFDKFTENADYIADSLKKRKDGVTLKLGSFTREALETLIVDCEHVLNRPNDSQFSMM